MTTRRRFSGVIRNLSWREIDFLQKKILHFFSFNYIYYILFIYIKALEGFIPFITFPSTLHRLVYFPLFMGNRA